MTPKLEQVIHVLKWVRIEAFVGSSWVGVGRPPQERAWLANAFVAKAVLGIGTTVGLMERLMVDRALRQLCGFPLHRHLPSQATFSRAFAEFAQTRLAERVHEALIKEHLGDALIGHISRDGTAIEARERPQARTQAAKPRGQRGGRRRGTATPADLGADTPGHAHGLRPRHQVQCAGLQDELERLQAAHRHRRLWRAHCRSALQRLHA
ncbi:hypothetical protein THIX_60723 [Thiomonas sp. X19]|nr:hypothetical protein THIX_60723 [Thiomonas sp. X19]